MDPVHRTPLVELVGDLALTAEDHLRDVVVDTDHLRRVDAVGLVLIFDADVAQVVEEVGLVLGRHVVHEDGHGRSVGHAPDNAAGPRHRHGDEGDGDPGHVPRSTGNWKLHPEYRFAGEISGAERALLADALDDGQYFAPWAVGLDHPLDAAGWSPTTDEDHGWLELDVDDITVIDVADGAPSVAGLRDISDFADTFAVADHHAAAAAYDEHIAEMAEADEEGDDEDDGEPEDGLWVDGAADMVVADATSPPPAAGRVAAVCGAAMPVAAARCVLAAGHAGAHRSTR